jgi:rhodanese-related sulfurtransferase
MKTSRKLILTIAAVWAVKALLTVLVGRSLAFPLLRGLIRLQYPGVEWISTRSLGAWLGDSARPAPLLLDVRTEREFAVSHLRGAIRVEPDGPIPDSLLGLPRTTPVVAYCAVGYRSAGLAERLREAGFTDVRNLTGSIFQWANEGRPLARGIEPADRVHPVNWWWGLLLRSNRRAQAG